MATGGVVLHPPDGEPHRVRSRAQSGRGCRWSATFIGERRTIPVADPQSCFASRIASIRFRRLLMLADGDGEADIPISRQAAIESDGVEAAVGPRRMSCPTGNGTREPGSLFHAGSLRSPERGWRGHRAAGTSARRRCRRRWPTGTDCPAYQYSRGGVRPPWTKSVGHADGGVQVNGQGPVAWSNLGLPRPGPATRCSPGRVDGLCPGGSCAGRIPRVDGALTVPPRFQAVPPVRNSIGSWLNAVAPSQIGGHQRA